jgi:protein-S-isoprenylcysteine O-methyltransferase Ste14
MGGITLADRFAKSRLIVSRIVVVVYLILYFVRGLWPVSITGEHRLMAVIGAVVVVLGALMRSWAAGVIRKNEGLSTNGPYRLARHPLYFGATLLATGFGLIAGDPWWWALVVLLALLIYVPTIRKEERKMRMIYPEAWKKFTLETGVMFPKQWPGKRMWMEWSLKQWLKNREYNAFFTSLVLMIGLLVLGTFR